MRRRLKIGLITGILLLGIFNFQTSGAATIAHPSVHAPLISLEDPSGSSWGWFRVKRGELFTSLLGTSSSNVFLAYGYVNSDGRIVFGCAQEGFVPFHKIQENGWIALVKAKDTNEAYKIAGRIHSCVYYRRINFPACDPVVSNENPYLNYGPTWINGVMLW